MKVRNGFVSNSSSSSFVIRGVEMRKEYVADCLGVQRDEVDFSDEAALYDAIWSKAYKKRSGHGKGAIAFADTRDFFDGPDTGTMLVGVSLAALDDGCVCRLPEPDDEHARKKISKFLDEDVTDDLHTYVQYVSNDNY